MKKVFTKSVSLFLAIILFVTTLNFGVSSSFADETREYWLSSDQGQRPYTEWYNATYAGDIQRLQEIYVYAKAGETIAFGSSATANLSYSSILSSMINSLGKNSSGEERIIEPASAEKISASIAVSLPSSEKSCGEKENDSYTLCSADVISKIGKVTDYSDRNIYLFAKTNATNGVISSRKAEKAGPKYSINGTEYNTDGYTPFSFEAPITGVYTFRFFSYVYNDINPIVSDLKDTPTKAASNSTVGAWDVSIIDKTKANPSDALRSGRIFTKALFLNIGGNNAKMYANVYALTDDGFEYKVDFNGMDPYGFLFYANNRGLLAYNSKLGVYESLMHSVNSTAGNNTFSDLPSREIYANLKPVESVDKTYLILFQQASPELLEWYTGRDRLVSSDDLNTSDNSFSNFKFTGFGNPSASTAFKEDGGFFTFDYTPSHIPGKQNPTSFEIILDFSASKGVTDNSNLVVLSNTLVEGKNTIFWNGKDANGKVVESGKYKVRSFYAKSGEIHFPFIDVENNINGIKISRLNDLSNENYTDSQNMKDTIYYNNTKLDNILNANIGSNTDKSVTGIVSTNGAMNYASIAGDNKLIDVWAKYQLQQKIMLETSTENENIITVQTKPAIIPKSINYYNRFKFTEPFTTSSYATMKINNVYVDPAKDENLTDYHIYMLKGNVGDEMPTKEEIKANSSTVTYSKGDSQIKFFNLTGEATGVNAVNRIGVSNPSTYIYQMQNPVWYCFDFTYNGVTYTTPVKDRCLYNVVDEYKKLQSNNNYHTTYEEAQNTLLESMLEMYDAVSKVVDSNATAENYKAGAKVNIANDVAIDNSKQFTSTTAIRNIQPWGLKYNFGVGEDLSKFDDYGAIVFVDKDNQFNGSMTATDIISNSSSKQYSSSTGNIYAQEDDNTKANVYCVDNLDYKDLSSDVYAVFFVKENGSYYFSNVAKNSYSSIANETDSSATDNEKAVNDSIAKYIQAVNDYKEYEQNNKNE